MHCIDIIKQHETTNTNININIKQNSIRKNASNIDRYISENDYGEMYTIERIENVNIIFFNWTSDSYTLHYIHKIGKYLIKDGELVYY